MPAERPTAPPGEAPTRRTVARAVSWMGVGYGASQGVFLASLIVLAAILEPRDFGTLASGMVLVNLAGLLVDSGTRGSIIAAPALTRADVSGAVGLNAGVGLAATVAIAALAGPIVDAFANGGDASVIRVLAVGVLLYAVGISPLALMQKRLEFKRFAAVNVASATLSALAGVAAGLLGAGVWALVVRQLAAMGLLSAFAWIAARDLLPAREEVGSRAPPWRLRQPGWLGFFGLALTDFVALNADFLIVGHLTRAQGLGLYSLAFTLAFAPLTQVSWQVGRVLFPATAATGDLATVGRRTLVSLRMMALLLVPFVPPVVALAPALPRLLGEQWKAMVAPFQILVVVGVGHALVGMIGESLSGTGHIGFRARVNAVWAVGMVGALVALVSADGIRGAALAHLALFVPFAAAYAVAGARRVGADVRRVGAALWPLIAPVGAQAAATAAAVAGLEALGAEPAAAAGVGAAAGVVVLAGLLLGLPSSPLPEGRAVVAAALGRGAPPAGGVVS